MIAVVTGAGSGIGRAAARALLDAGWSVVAAGRREAPLAETIGGSDRGLAVPADVTSADSVTALFAAVQDRFGRLDLLFNNAGLGVSAPIAELALEDWRRVVDTNLTGPILLTKRVVGAWRAAKQPGDIVFVTSDTAVNPRPYMATYGVAKVALESFARILALECEDTGIRSSVVRVGPTLTGFGDSWDPALFADILPAWTRFGIQRHFNTMQPEDVARADVTAVTAPAHMWVPVIEVQPLPPAT